MVARRKVTFEQIVLPASHGVVGNDVEATSKKPEKLGHEIAPIDNDLRRNLSRSTGEDGAKEAVISSCLFAAQAL